MSDTQELFNPDEQKVYDLLDEMGIAYQVRHHVAVFTTEDAQIHRTDFPGIKMKNLFVKDRTNEIYYLVVLGDDRRLNFNELKRLTGGKKANFTTPEELDHYLGLIPGSVTPFGLIHENAKDVVLVLDHKIVSSPDDQQINFHPCVNTATIALSIGDFKKVLQRFGNRIVEEQYEGQLDKVAVTE